MRDDMFKVIVERPRLGGSVSIERPVGAFDEDARAHESLKHRHMQRKWLNENLNPLRRWLERQVDRPWDKVYSELCAGIDVRSTVQQHIRQHVEDFVAVTVLVIDGELFVPGYSGPEPLVGRWGGPRLYVDPRTGILRRNRKRDTVRAQRRAERNSRWEVPCPHPRRIVSDSVQLHRLDGVWYEVAIAPIPATPVGLRRWTAPPYDVVLHCDARNFNGPRNVAPPNVGLYGKPGWYAVRRRQLNRTELASHGLHND